MPEAFDKVTASSLLGIFADCDPEILVLVAACAQLVLERKLDTFCVGCGRRLGMAHAVACVNFEPDDVVREFDCPLAEALIAKRLVVLRGGGE